MDKTQTRPLRLGPTDVTLEVQAEGCSILRSCHELGSYPAKLTDRLQHWATTTPDQTFLAARGPDGEWQKLNYAQAMDQVLHVASSSAHDDGSLRFYHYTINGGTDVVAAAPREGEDHAGRVPRRKDRR